jgi:O-antigen/teichoic acid export membrane protein
LLSQIKRVSKEIVIYGIGNAAGSIVSFLLLPLYTKFLTPEDYGYLALFTVFQSVIETTAVFGLSSGLFRYYCMAKDEAEQQVVMNTCFWTQALFICVLAAITFPFAGNFSQILLGSGKFSRYISIVTATGLMSAFSGFIFSFMRAKRKPLIFAVTQIVKVTLLALTSIYFVAVLHWGYSGIITGNLLVFIAIALLLVLWYSRFVGFSFSIPYFKRIMVFISPIFVVNIFFLLLNLSDRFFLNHFLAPADVGLFSFGNKLGSIVMIGVITPFSIAIVPYALSIVKEDHFKKTFAKIIKYFFLVLVYLSLWIFLFSKEIVLLVSNPAYTRASGIIGPTLLSSIFYGLYYNLSIAIDIVEKTYLATIIVITGAIVSIGLNYLTIPVLGMYGSALASCVSNAVLFLMVYYFCQKHYPIQYEIGAFIKVMGIIVLYIGLSYLIAEANLREVIAIPIKIILCILSPIAFFVIRVFDLQEREYAKKYFLRMIPAGKQAMNEK